MQAAGTTRALRYGPFRLASAGTGRQDVKTGAHPVQAGRPVKIISKSPPPIASDGVTTGVLGRGSKNHLEPFEAQNKGLSFNTPAHAESAATGGRQKNIRSGGSGERARRPPVRKMGKLLSPMNSASTPINAPRASSAHVFVMRWHCPTCGAISQKDIERLSPTDLVICERGHIYSIRELHKMWVVEAIEEGA